MSGLSEMLLSEQAKKLHVDPSINAGSNAWARQTYQPPYSTSDGISTSLTQAAIAGDTSIVCANPFISSGTVVEIDPELSVAESVTVGTETTTTGSSSTLALTANAGSQSILITSNTGWVEGNLLNIGGSYYQVISYAPFGPYWAVYLNMPLVTGEAAGYTVQQYYFTYAVPALANNHNSVAVVTQKPTGVTPNNALAGSQFLQTGSASFTTSTTGLATITLPVSFQANIMSINITLINTVFYPVVDNSNSGVLNALVFTLVDSGGNVQDSVAGSCYWMATGA